MTWDLKGVLSSLTEGATIQRKTQAAGTWSRGVFVPGGVTITTIDGMPLPLEGDELDRLPEGMRTKELREVFTTIQVANGDLLTFEGFDWEVQRVEKWPANFWRVIAAKVGT